MPYKAVGNWVYIKRKGRWVRYKRHGSAAKAKRHADALNINVGRKERVQVMAKRKKTKAHPGFKAVARKIARRRGKSLKRARAILAASTRRASAAAKRRNPRLKRVKGKAKRKKKK
jgi:hypothetical protein